MDEIRDKYDQKNRRLEEAIEKEEARKIQIQSEISGAAKEESERLQQQLNAVNEEIKEIEFDLINRFRIKINSLVIGELI